MRQAYSLTRSFKASHIGGIDELHPTLINQVLEIIVLTYGKLLIILLLLELFTNSLKTAKVIPIFTIAKKVT